jgi:hypothetical protein
VPSSGRAIIRFPDKGSAASGRPRVYPPWTSEDDRVIPVTIEWDRVLIDTPVIVAYASELCAYPSGFDLQISAALRPDESGVQDRDLEARVRLGPANNPRDPDTAEELAAMFRVGVQFADGRGAVADPTHHRGPRAPDLTLPMVAFGRRHWSAGIADGTVRVYGLPDQGDVTLFYQWLEFEVPESSVVIDGDALRAAAERATVLWEHPGT